MLSIAAMSKGSADYYLGLAREDYYLQGGEPPGQWYGQGAALLNLSGLVEANQLYNLFDGRSPFGDRSLIQRQYRSGELHHRPGYDLTFSAPKSVSVLWSQAGEETRQAIQGIHARAVGDALRYLEETAAFTKRGKAGAVQEQAGLVVATFEHSTSRALDPQLHTHALVLNVCVRADGTTGTLKALDLFLAKMVAGALYRTSLSQGLRENLGLSLARENSWFRIEGVDPGLIQEFSKRREAIEELLRSTGLSSAEAAAAAAIQSREAKGLVKRTEFFDDWARTGERHGWTRAEAEGLLWQVLEALDRQAELTKACSRAIERITQDEAYFTEREFLRYVAEEAQTRSLTVDEVRKGTSIHLAVSPEIVRLGERNGEFRYSTRMMVELEKGLLSDVELLERNDLHKLHADTLVRKFAEHGSLSEEQLKAVWHIASETGGIAVVSGMAGTGKTRMLGVAREAWEAEGYEVRGATIAAKAAAELTDGAGVPARTIAKTLRDLGEGVAPLNSKTILIVDEAGMVATPDMGRLASFCKQAGAKLVLIGDERQLQPIGPGAPFKELGLRHGQASLTDIRRQDEEWAREAVKDMAAGRSTEALAAFAQRGLLSVAETRTESMRDLIRQWREDGGLPEETLILAGTRKEVQTLNQFAQEERRLAGELGEASIRVDAQQLYLGDRVMFTQNKLTIGVRNGAKGIVCAVGSDGSQLSIRLDSGDRVSVSPKVYPHVVLGYATTTHKAQGATTQRAYVLGGGPMQGRELAYVQTSRARIETRIFATAAETGDDVMQLAREMARSRQKELAHSLLREQPRLSF